MEGSDLIFHVPRLSSIISEADAIHIAGLTLSLVSLPPDASFYVSADGCDAVKVLHGRLGWIDSQSRLIERTPLACPPGCVTSMLVDSPEGRVRSGNDGAVFVRMRPSSVTDDFNLKALNAVPSYFPCDVRDFEFRWRAIKGLPGRAEFEAEASEEERTFIFLLRVEFFCRSTEYTVEQSSTCLDFKCVSRNQVFLRWNQWTPYMYISGQRRLGLRLGSTSRTSRRTPSRKASPLAAAYERACRTHQATEASWSATTPTMVPSRRPVHRCSQNTQRSCSYCPQ